MSVTTASHPKNTTSKHLTKLDLSLSPQVFKILNDLADESGQDMAHVLKSGIALYDIAIDAEHQGKHLAIAQHDEVQQTIHLSGGKHLSNDLTQNSNEHRRNDKHVAAFVS